MGNNTSTTKHLRACYCCGMIQQVPVLQKNQVAECVRCGSSFRRRQDKVTVLNRTAAAALATFFLFWPAILLPILEIEQLGMKSRSSILGGIVELYSHGSYFVATIVFVFSIIFPLTKVVLLLELSFLELLDRKHKAFTFKIMQGLGKWSMMDVLLLAFLVMLVKLGDMIEFHFGPAIIAFTMCVTMSMIASLSFDHHVIWQDAPLIDDEIVPPIN